MPPTESPAARHWLLPHERWLGRFAGRAGDPAPGGRAWAAQQNYGPDGNLFLSAIAADAIAAGLLGFTGVILLLASKSSGSVAAAGYWLIGVAVLSALIGIVRSIQGSHAGRVFRAGRPFVRPGQRSR